MNFDKVILILIVCVMAVVLFDMYTKYSAEKRSDALASQKESDYAQYLLQQGQQSTDDRGFLGGLLHSIPLLGGLY